MLVSESIACTRIRVDSLCSYPSRSPVLVSESIACTRIRVDSLCSYPSRHTGQTSQVCAAWPVALSELPTRIATGRVLLSDSFPSHSLAGSCFESFPVSLLWRFLFRVAVPSHRNEHGSKYCVRSESMPIHFLTGNYRMSSVVRRQARPEAPAPSPPLPFISIHALALSVLVIRVMPRIPSRAPQQTMRCVHSLFNSEKVIRAGPRSAGPPTPPAPPSHAATPPLLRCRRRLR